MGIKPKPWFQRNQAKISFPRPMARHLIYNFRAINTFPVISPGYHSLPPSVILPSNNSVPFSVRFLQVCTYRAASRPPMFFV